MCHLPICQMLTCHTRPQGEVRDVDAYLERMGVTDASLRARVEGALPWTDPADLAGRGSTASGLPLGPVEPLNRAARDWAAIGRTMDIPDADASEPLFVVSDAAGGLAGQRATFAAMRRSVFALHFPAVSITLVSTRVHNTH